jgi:hypothetical protein
MRILSHSPNGTRVSVSRAEVAAFKATWPGCNLLAGPYSFTFDSRGSLVDMSGCSRIGRDDDRALLALSESAQEYARNFAPRS